MPASAAPPRKDLCPAPGPGLEKGKETEDEAKRLTFPRPRPRQVRPQFQVLPNRELSKEQAPFRDARDPQGRDRVRRQAIYSVSLEADCSPARGKKPGERANEGRLA